MEATQTGGVSAVFLGVYNGTMNVGSFLNSGTLLGALL